MLDTGRGGSRGGLAAMHRRATWVLVCAFLVACTPRAEIVMNRDAEVLGQLKTIFVGTTRSTDPETGRYTDRRQADERFQRYVVSIPPSREPGEITWPRAGAPADPTRHFVTVSADSFRDGASFRAAIGQVLGERPRGTREVVIYVHGFNNTFAEGLYRIAQMSADLEIPAETVYYAWPSAGNALGYVHDRDSALFARDGLERLIDQLVLAGADRVLLVAHSLGSALTMETLRQIALRGDRRTIDRIAGVMLISPDIDIDVFRAQAQVIGVLPQPFVIFTSRRDGALALSARLTGASDRLGNLRDLSSVADLPVTVVEAGAFRDGDAHFTLGTSPALIRLLANATTIDAALESDRIARIGLLPGAVLTVQNATRIILSPVVSLAQEFE